MKYKSFLLAYSNILNKNEQVLAISLYPAQLIIGIDPILADFSKDNIEKIAYANSEPRKLEIDTKSEDHLIVVFSSIKKIEYAEIEEFQEIDI